jgi:hypothetical protein
LIGAPPALDEDTGPWRHVVWALPGGTLLGIHEHPGKTDASDSFSEYRIGLDHVAFGCASRADLVEWAARLDALGYAHGEIQDAPTATRSSSSPRPAARGGLEPSGL